MIEYWLGYSFCFNQCDWLFGLFFSWEKGAIKHN